MRRDTGLYFFPGVCFQGDDAVGGDFSRVHPEAGVRLLDAERLSVPREALERAARHENQARLGKRGCIDQENTCIQLAGDRLQRFIPVPCNIFHELLILLKRLFIHLSDARSGDDIVELVAKKQVPLCFEATIDGRAQSVDPKAW